MALDRISLRLDAGAAAGRAAAAMRDFAIGLPIEKLNFDFGLDPLGVVARGGAMDEAMLDLAPPLVQGWTGSRAFLADGRAFQEAGASPAGELASVLASALFYLRALEQRSVELDMARCGIAFLLTTDTDIFLNMAKFRALRFLWARVEEACGLSLLPIRLHAETSWRMLTREACC